MKEIGSMTAEDVVSDAVLEEVFSDEDEIHKARLLLTLEDHAAALGVKTRFGKMVAAYRRVEKQIRKAEKDRPARSLDNWTGFEGPYDNMYCGSWIAREDGIYVQNTGTVDVVACYHPILPVERLKNLETGEEQIKIAYKRNGVWEEIIVPKTLITSANRIVALSGRGIAVTSENARLLVRYLSDVENMNGASIPVQRSSSKLGWIRGEFLPYDTDIVFDGDSRFRQVFESIRECGDREVWYRHIRAIRATGRIEARFMLAASFASILLPVTGSLPYIVDLWGETEGGKTVSLMLACSVWANPAESSYIGDFKTTDVALEARADVLNHLPMMLDDTSKASQRIRDNFEGMIYDLCSGKGKSRSNRELGMNRENRWQNAILTNGERPLSSYVTQGGAMNRILELECGERVYADPQYTAEILKQHYGFAGKDFVEAVKKLGSDAVREIQAGFQAWLRDDGKMQKQSIALSVVLTADKIATDHLFRDGQYISIDEARAVLMDREELSENERAYEFIVSEVEININKFRPDSCTGEYKGEVWGCMENGYAVILNNAFSRICEKGGFSGRSFLSWAVRNGLVQTQGGRNYKNKKFYGRAIRCVWLQMPDNGGFDEITEADMLPF